MTDVLLEGSQTAKTKLSSHGSIEPADEGKIPWPEGSCIFFRKVARSGHISYEGHPYFISKLLAGRYICLVVLADRLVVDTSIPLHKEYLLT